MVSYLLVAGATLLELLCTIFVINGLVGEKRQIPVINAIVFSVFTLMYVLLVPNVLTTGSYLIILLYVKFSYKETWKNSIIWSCCYNHRVITKIRYFRDIVIGFCNKIATNLFVIMRDNAEICMFHSIW